jgi:replicative DNA helicase
MLGLLEDSRPLDEILLYERLKALGIDEQLGGLERIFEIQGRVETASHFRYFLGLVLQTWKQRQMVRLGREIAELAAKPGDSFDEVRRALQVPLTRLGTLSTEEPETDVMAEMEEFFEGKEAEMRGEIERVPEEYRVHFWMPSIEEKFGYVDARSSDNNIVIGGPSSYGKSTLLRQGMNANLLKHPDWVIVYFIVEGSRIDYYHNSACAYAKIPNDVPLNEYMNDSVHRGGVDAEVAQKRLAAYFKFREFMRSSLRSRLYLLENDMMIDDIVNRCREIRSRHGRLDLIGIDYQQVVGAANIKGVNREQQVSEVSGKIKRLQKDMGCPVLSGSQLNTDGEARESKAIYQDATRFWRIGRPAKWKDGQGHEKTQALMGLKGYHQTLEQPKSRNGKTGWASYKLNAEMGRCEDYGAIPEGKRGRPKKASAEDAAEF